MTLIDFQDAVTASNLNPNDKYGVYYLDGHFANYRAVRARMPRAKLYGITVFGAVGPGVFAADSELGDMPVPLTLAWTEKQIHLGVKLICNYANLNRWLNEGLLKGVLALERKYNVKTKKWVANYNNLRSIPSWADADQYADPGPIDRDVALANFFEATGPVVKPKPPVAHNSGIARFEGTVDLATEKVKTIHGLPGTNVHLDGPPKNIDVHVRLRAGKGGGQWGLPS